MAAENGLHDAVVRLLEHGANPDLVNTVIHTSLHA